MLAPVRMVDACTFQKSPPRGATLPKETDGGARLGFPRMDFSLQEAGQQRNTSFGVWRTDGWSSL